MVIQRSEVWWADLEEPRGPARGHRRPVLAVQADAFNRSRIEAVIVVILTSNLRLLDAPGNVLVPKKVTGLPKDSVGNVSPVVTLDRELLTERIGKLPFRLMAPVEDGLRLVLSRLTATGESAAQVTLPTRTRAP